VEYLRQRCAALEEESSGKSSIEKSCFSIQQTQKSFSIMASGKAFRAAVSANKSARSRAGIWQLCSRGFLRDPFRHFINPVHTESGIFHETAFFLSATGFFRNVSISRAPTPSLPNNEALERQVRTYPQAPPLLFGRACLK